MRIDKRPMPPRDMAEAMVVPLNWTTTSPLPNVVRIVDLMVRTHKPHYTKGVRSSRWLKVVLAK